MIKYIVISLCDNDFGSAFRGYMETLKRVLTYDPDINKEKLKKIIWEGIMFHVIAYSVHYDENYENEYDRLKSYFENHMEILFNEEAMRLALTADHDNGSYYLDVLNGQIGSF